jgi:ribonuclease HI
MNRRGSKKAANYSIANYLKTDSKAMVTQILDKLIENAVNHSKKKRKKKNTLLTN